MKIAVATPPVATSLKDGIDVVAAYALDAATQGAKIICFPESYLPGYPIKGDHLLEATPEALADALRQIQAIAKATNIAIIIPMDAYFHGKPYNVAFVIDNKGVILGHQAKVQLDPSEDLLWAAGEERKLFQIDDLTFGIVICHEGFRYPETVRWAARYGAQLVFHPYYGGNNENGVLPSEWASPKSSYYEKAQMCRALENTIYYASSNNQFVYPEGTSAVIDPQGHCMDYQPYGTEGVLVVDIDLGMATNLLSSRYKPIID